MPAIPPPYETFVDPDTGKIKDVWWRYFDENRVQLDTASYLQASKAWGVVSIDTSTSIATLSTGYNVASVETTASLLRVNLTKGFATTNYSVVATAMAEATTIVHSAEIVDRATTTFTIEQKSTAGVTLPPGWNFACYGAQ